MNEYECQFMCQIYIHISDKHILESLYAGASHVELVIENPLANTRRCKRCGFDPWVRKIPWRRTWQPTAVFLPGESHGHMEPGGL